MTTLFKSPENSSYFGMVKIHLATLWNKNTTGSISLSPASFKGFNSMRSWLEDNKIKHKFVWIDTGQYLPDYIYIETGQDATAFKLKYDM